MSELKKTLYDAFGGFADKRIKNLDRGDTFIIDDRSSTDIGADKQLYSYFCLMFATVLDETHLQVMLRGNIPRNEEVDAWLKANNAEIMETPQTSATFIVESGSQSNLLGLADAIASIVAPGKRYPIANYKYVCPRTPGSLERLKSALDVAWGS